MFTVSGAAVCERRRQNRTRMLPSFNVQELLVLLGASTREGGLPPFVSAVVKAEAEPAAATTADKEPPAVQAAAAALSRLAPTTHWHHTTFELLSSPTGTQHQQQESSGRQSARLELPKSLATFTTIEEASGETDVFNECFENDASLSSKVRYKKIQHT
jgi:hypothetical protein